MSKIIKIGKNGKPYYADEQGQFLGRPPQPVSVPSPEIGKNLASPFPTKEELTQPVDDVHSLYAQKRSIKELESWQERTPFPLLNAEVSNDWVVLTDHEYVDEDSIEFGDQDKTVMCRRDKADLFLRAEKVKSSTYPNGTVVDIYTYPAYRNADGSCAGMRVEKDLYVKRYHVGTVDEENNFTESHESFSGELQEHIGERGCPLASRMDGLIEDYQYRNITDPTTGEVKGLYLKVEAESIEVDPYSYAGED